MKRLILTLILLIGVYTILRNNVFKLPDQIIWITNHNFIFKVILPFLMSISAAFSLFFLEAKCILDCPSGQCW